MRRCRPSGLNSIPAAVCARQADLQAILAHLASDPDELLAGTGADRPVVAVRVRASVGRPGVKGAQTRSCSSPVLVEQTAEQVVSTQGASILPDGRPGGRIWWLQPKRPVGTVAVVMLDVDP